MPGSQTTPGPTGARNNAPADFAFRQVNNVGTRIDNDFSREERRLLDAPRADPSVPN